jgi:aminoglycoside 2'-N-acetyltransferase I
MLDATGPIRTRASADITLGDVIEIRALLDAAFDGAFSDDDWAHALGGIHAILEDGSGIVGHGAVVPRILDVGTLQLTVGYVEAIAVRPDRQGAGLGTEIMRALNAVIARDYPLGVLSTGEWAFYARLGWERWQGPTWVRYGEGRRERTLEDDDSVMILRTPMSPTLDLSWPIACDARTGDAW